jgi:hypothetical protein
MDFFAVFLGLGWVCIDRYHGDNDQIWVKVLWVCGTGGRMTDRDDGVFLIHSGVETWVSFSFGGGCTNLIMRKSTGSGVRDDAASTSKQTKQEGKD